MMDIFRVTENAVILLRFIFYPFYYQINPKWIRAYPDLHYLHEDTMISTPHFRKNIYEKLGGKPKNVNSAIMRR